MGFFSDHKKWVLRVCLSWTCCHTSASLARTPSIQAGSLWGCKWLRHKDRPLQLGLAMFGWNLIKFQQCFKQYLIDNEKWLKKCTNLKENFMLLFILITKYNLFMMVMEYLYNISYLAVNATGSFVNQNGLSGNYPDTDQRVP